MNQFAVLKVKPELNTDTIEERETVLVPGVVSLVESQRRTLKQGDTFAIFDHYGDISEGEHSPAGVFHLDTRFLSHLRLSIAGRLPLMLSSIVQPDNAILNVDLTNPDLFVGEKVVLAKDSFHISRTKFLWNAGCHELFIITNFATHAERLRVALDFGCDFADMFEVRGHHRSTHGNIHAQVSAPNVVTYTYDGLDKIERRARLCFNPAPTRISPRRVEFELDFGPRQRSSIGCTLQCLVGPAEEKPPDRFFTAIRRAQRASARSGAACAQIETSNNVINEVLQRSTADLAMLTTQTAYGPYPYAGIPWFSTPFGRDGLITAIEMLWLDPSIARGVLRFLAAHQADHEDPHADSEPGKILHEMRQCELANLGEVPFGRYYGSIDSTPLFIVLAGLYWRRSADRETLNEIWPNILAALTWIDRYGDVDGDGFIEYGRKRDSGLRNQGWKDADDSVFHADGRLAHAPIALCEVQGYVYFAKTLAFEMATARGDASLAARLATAAQTLKTRFEEQFWDEQLGTYAMALDGDKRPCAIRTSNAGQVLFSGIASKEHAARVAQALFGRDMFSGWGIRTLSRCEARYNPTSYHDGSIWPHDNALIALGLARYGHTDEVLRLTSALFDTAAVMEWRRLPELFCGFPRRRRSAPTSYPVACSPQAWAACTPFALLHACLGIELDAAGECIRLLRPHLPESMEWLAVRNLQIGKSKVDLLLQGRGGNVSVNLLKREGDAKVDVLL
jgi:glycogen debranching enzyme